FGQAGKYGVRLTVTDGQQTSSQTFTITVAVTNQPPQLVPVAPQVGREGTRVQFKVAAGDPDGDPVTLTALPGLPQGATFEPGNGNFTWTPDYGLAGDYTITFQAQDNHGTKDTLDVQVHIDVVPRPPVLHVSSHQALLGQPLQFTVSAQNLDF